MDLCNAYISTFEVMDIKETTAAKSIAGPVTRKSRKCPRDLECRNAVVTLYCHAGHNLARCRLPAEDNV